MDFVEITISVEPLEAPAPREPMTEIAVRVEVLKGVVGEAPPIDTRLLLLNYEQLDRLEELVQSPDQESGLVAETTGRDFIRLFGEQLFTSTLGVWAQLPFALAQAQSKDAGLRIRIRSRDPLLAAQPWELMHSQDQGGFLSLLPRLSIVREPLRVGPQGSLGATRPLRVLLCAAEPNDLPDIDVENEINLIRTQLSGFGAAVELEIIPGTYAALSQAVMERGPWHIFHFSGHGDYHPGIGGVLAFELPNGSSDIYDAATVASLLTQQRSIRLVVLNACRGAKGLGRRGHNAVATAIIQQGVPCAITMQFSVTDSAALPFAEQFYRALVTSGDVEQALLTARSAISRAPLPKSQSVSIAQLGPIVQALRCMEWCTPVLHLDTSDGRLFAESSNPGTITDRLKTMKFSPKVGPPSVARPQPIVGLEAGNATLTKVSRLHWRLTWITELPPDEALSRVHAALQAVLNPVKLDVTPLGLVAYSGGLGIKAAIFATERVEASAAQARGGTAVTVESQPNQMILLDQGRNRGNLTRLAAFLRLTVR
jgi:hypothetical protein